MNYPQTERNLIKTILSFAKKEKVKLYLVGGYLRDIILNRQKPNPDIDFCLKDKAIRFSQRLSRKLKAGFVVLDKEHGCARLVKRIDNRFYTLDFTDFRAKTLEQDLSGRDFTINALAIELESFLKTKHWQGLLIDPFGARKDLKSGIIRQVNKNGFDQDPLRVLRAFSLAAIFGFKIEKETVSNIRRKKNKLSGVSSERVRDELFKILDSPAAFGYFLEMDKLGILKIIIPEIEPMRGLNQGPYHHLDIWKHTLETLRNLETISVEFKNNQDIMHYLNQVISGGRRRLALIKLGALLHDIGKPKARRREDGKTKFHGHERIGRDITEGISRRLKLSNDELEALNRVVFWHLRPGYLADNQPVTARAKFRYFRDTANEAVSILLISLADQRSTRGRLTTKESRIQHEKLVRSLIREYFRKKKEKKMPRLITGDDLIKQFKLSPSPLIGKILREIEELQAIGRIKTKQEALKVARRLVK